MASLKTVNMDGAEQAAVDGKDSIFAVEPNDALVREVITSFQNAKRQGTHKVKIRHEVSGGGIKPFRQKGTGRARQGSSREPHMRGGGVVFGPAPRSYRQKVTSRARRQAMCSILSDRVSKDRLSILSGLKIEAVKTKPFAQMLGNVAPEGRKTLLVTAEQDDNVVLSARNIPQVTVRTASDVNALDVISAVRIVIQEEALARLEERLS